MAYIWERRGIDLHKNAENKSWKYMKGKNNKVIKVIMADSKRIFLTEIN